MIQDADFILCECKLEPLTSFVEGLESFYQPLVSRTPSLCTVMIPAEDSVEGQPFYLGEALVTECEVVLNEQAGFGICLGDEPVRCYCIAFLDAAMQLKDAHYPAIMNFLKEQDALVTEAHVVEYNHIQRTKVDFKLMEQD